MNFGVGFSFAFRDPDFIKKILLTGLITLIPIVGPLYLVGWGVEIARRVSQGNDEPLLPDIDFGAFIKDGFMMVVIQLVYAVPILILAIPMAVVPVAIAAIAGGNSDNQGLAALAILPYVCCGSLIFIYSIFMAFLIPAATGNYAAKGTIKDGLNFKEVFGLVRAAPVAFLIVIVGALLAGFIGNAIGGVACGVGVLFTMPWTSAFTHNLIGQAYRQASQKNLY